MSTVLVTGSSRGIGLATARRFYNGNYNVVINYNKSEHLLPELKKEFPGALFVKADVSKEEEVIAMFSLLREKFLSLDVLVNNAGISDAGLFIDKSMSDIDRVIDTNIKGMLYCTKQALSMMLEKNGGSIINISSIWGEKGAANESIYSLTKGAVNAFTKSVAKEYAFKNIRINAVLPGFIDTEMNSMYSEDERIDILEQIPLGRAGNPEEVAELVYYLAGEKASYITGQLINCDGGWSV